MAPEKSFEFDELTVARLHEMLGAGELTVRSLVQAYLDRIEAIDRSGPALNSIITTNPKALDEAERLDRAYAESGNLTGPLHGVPVVVKDQAETVDMPTTFGSIAQDGYVPKADATVIRKLKEAGAIIFAKTALPDFATSWFGFSSKAGETKNPYVLSHDPGGSSSGTAAAVAANLALLGIGEDTGGSIRLPASFSNLVGVRVTPGLVSRTGMSPLVTFQDTAGPMTRTVEDAGRLLDAIVGFDESDDYTAAAIIEGHRNSFAEASKTGSLEGRRFGVVRNAFGSNDEHESAEVNTVIEGALDAMRQAGATVEDVEIPDLIDHILETSLYLTHSRYDINSFLAARPDMPVGTLEEIRERKLYAPELDLLEAIFEGPAHPHDDPEYFQKLAARDGFQRLVLNIVGKGRFDALVFPCIQVLPPSKEDVRQGRHEVLSFPTNTLIASQTWMPSICLPAGFSSAGLPVGMEMIVPPYQERDLFILGGAFERTLSVRRPPDFKESLDG